MGAAEEARREIYGGSKRGQEVSWCEGKRAGLDGENGSTVATSEENKERRRGLMLHIYSTEPNAYICTRNTPAERGERYRPSKCPPLRCHKPSSGRRHLQSMQLCADNFICASSVKCLSVHLGRFNSPTPPAADSPVKLPPVISVPAQPPGN